MAFSEAVVNQAWNNASGRCERCGKMLLKSSRGSESLFGWEAHHKARASILTSSDSLSNCEILCQDCHKKTYSYGR